LCVVQDGAKSWALLAPWLNVITVADFKEDMFKLIQPSILPILYNNFHLINCDGSSGPLEQDYDQLNLEDTVYHLRAIQRRVDGNDYLAPTTANRDKVEEEFKRISWSTGKLPTILNWYGM
jgi:hypothetical protein